MKKQKKYNKAEMLSFIFCFVGCLLLMAPLIIDSEIDLFMTGIAINGIGLMIFLFGPKSGEIKK